MQSLKNWPCKCPDKSTQIYSFQPRKLQIKSQTHQYKLQGKKKKRTIWKDTVDKWLMFLKVQEKTLNIHKNGIKSSKQEKNISHKD